MKRFLFMMAACSVVALSGCPGCFSTTQDFCIEAAKIGCQLQYRCCTAQERAQLFGGTNLSIGPYHDEGGCVEAFVRQCEASSQATDEAIAAGRLSFDQDRANQCLNTRREAVDKCDADTLFNNDEDCNDLISGLVADGDACFASNECAEAGSTCEIDSEPDPDGNFVFTLEGTCKGKGDEGEPCLDDGRCNDEALRCLFDPDTFDQTCEQPRGAGERCQQDFDCQDGLRCEFGTSDLVCTAPAQQGEPCDSDTDCADGLSCEPDANFNDVCTVRGALGVRCFSDSECQNGLLCAQDPVTFTSVCQTTSGSGEPCPGGDAQCQPGLTCRFDTTTSDNRCFGGANGEPCDFGDRCAPGLLCRLDAIQGRDECQPPLGQNQDCEQFEPEVCDPALRCVDNDGDFNFTCSTPLAANSPCDIGSNGVDPCDATHRCEFDDTAVDNICVPRLGAGAAGCSEDRDCTAGTFCDFNQARCTALKNEGAQCLDDRECASGLRCRDNDAGTANICRSLSDAGEGCASDNDCATGLDCRLNDAGTANICRGASLDGARCQVQGDCGDGLDCRFNDTQTFEICRALSEDGGICEDQLDCAADLNCRTDPNDFRQRCLGRFEAGEICGVDGDCVDGLVCRFNGNVGNSVCTELLANGAPCPSFNDGDCQAGLRCRDVANNGTPICTDKRDFGEDCAEDNDCLTGFCDPDGEFCSEEPPEIDFEVCNGLN